MSPPPSEPTGAPPSPAGSPEPAPSAAGDYSAFFRATLRPLRRYIARLVGSNHEAQDIAQESYARVFKVMQARPVDHPQALLYATARNLSIDELKHRQCSPFAQAPRLDLIPSSHPGIEAMVMAREECALLAQAISQLPDAVRDVFLLRTDEHLTFRQIADRLNLTPKQVEKRLYRAVQLLHAAVHSTP